MASSFSISTVLLLIITVVNSVLVTAVPEHEYRSMLAALRFRGYHLFANAITTTDIHYDIINGGNFTFFAPTDSALYALDMSMSAADYTTALRFHGVPRRLSLPDLRMLSYGSNSFPTLVRGHEIHIVNPMPFPLPIMVEGIDIAYPGLFYDTHIAVHGLDGMIDFRSVMDSRNSTSDLKDEVTLDSTSDQASQSIDTADYPPMTGQREIYALSPQVAVPVAAPPLQSSIVTGIDTAAASPVSNLPQTSFVPSSDVSPVHGISVAPRHRQPEACSESITQPHEEHMSISTKSDLISQEIHDSITQPREEHISTAMSGSIFPRIHDVSHASKSTGKAAEEFTQVDEKIIDRAIAGDDDGEQLNIANIRDGDLYMRELYTPTKMTCANE